MVTSAAQRSSPFRLFGSPGHQGMPPAWAAPLPSAQAEGSAELRCRPVHAPALQALSSAGVSCKQRSRQAAAGQDSAIVLHAH
jgi:hypothetical protein